MTAAGANLLGFGNCTKLAVPIINARTMQLCRANIGLLSSWHQCRCMMYTAADGVQKALDISPTTAACVESEHTKNKIRKPTQL
jgi:hypothetical protein